MEPENFRTPGNREAKDSKNGAGRKAVASSSWGFLYHARPSQNPIHFRCVYAFLLFTLVSRNGTRVKFPVSTVYVYGILRKDSRGIRESMNEENDRRSS